MAADPSEVHAPPGACAAMETRRGADEVEVLLLTLRWRRRACLRMARLALERLIIMRSFDAWNGMMQMRYMTEHEAADETIAEYNLAFRF